MIKGDIYAATRTALVLICLGILKQKQGEQRNSVLFVNYFFVFSSSELKAHR